MSTKKMSNIIIAGSLLLTLVSCGKDDKKSKSHAEINPVCSEIDCLSSINWRIQLEGRSFPYRSRVDVNGTTVLNECMSKQKYAIDRTSNPEVLYLDNFYVPRRGELKIDIIDLGSDCDSAYTFISNDKVDFEVNKTGGFSEIVISL